MSRIRYLSPTQMGDQWNIASVLRRCVWIFKCLMQRLMSSISRTQMNCKIHNNAFSMYIFCSLCLVAGRVPNEWGLTGEDKGSTRVNFWRNTMGPWVSFWPQTDTRIVNNPTIGPTSSLDASSQSAQRSANSSLGQAYQTTYAVLSVWFCNRGERWQCALLIVVSVGLL